MLRIFPVLIVLSIVACGGASVNPSPSANQPADNIDSETALQWSEWSLRALNIANTTARMYSSGVLTPARAIDQQDQARALAGEVRNAEQTTELLLNLADDLDDFIEALEFGLEFAANANILVINIRIPTLEDALTEITRDAVALAEVAQTP